MTDNTKKERIFPCDPHVVITAKAIFHAIQVLAGSKIVCLERIERRFQKLQFQWLDHINPLDYSLYTENGKFLSQVQTNQLRQSHVIICPPIIIEGKHIPINPIVSVARYTDPDRCHSSLVHELVHLYASGDWIVGTEDSKTLLYHTGVACYVYDIGHASAKQFRSINVFSNEVLTDYIASIIYALVYQKNYTSCMAYRDNLLYPPLESLNPHEQSCLIAAYFNNEVETIMDILASFSSWSGQLKPNV